MSGRPDPKDVAEDSYLDRLAALSDAELLTLAMQADEDFVALRDVRGKLNTEVLRRFPAGRSQWISGDVVAEMAPVYGDYEWFPDDLRRAFEGRVTPKQMADMFTEEEIPASIRTKVNTAAVKRVAKAVGVDLEGTYHRSERMPMLKYREADDGVR